MRVRTYENLGYRGPVGAAAGAAGGACGSICVSLMGVFVMLLATWLMVYNEGRAVDTATALDEGLSRVRSITDGQTAKDGQLVHIIGRAEGGHVSDNEFGLSLDNAIALNRYVDMYQWREREVTVREEQNYRGETIRVKDYEYTQDWHSDLQSKPFSIPGRAFPPNPSNLPFGSLRAYAPTVRVGKYRLQSALVQRIGGFQQLDVHSKLHDTKREDSELALAASSNSHALLLPNAQKYSTVISTNDGRELVEHRRWFRTSRSELQLKRREPPHNSIGDVRVSFAAVFPHTVSIIAQVQEGTLGPYQSSNGVEVLSIVDGTMSATEMFEREHAQNSFLTWMLRVVGFFVMLFGMFMFFAPISFLISTFGNLPLIGGIISSVAGAGMCFITFSLALAATLVVVSVAWFYARPTVSIALLAIVAIQLFVFHGSKGKVKDDRAAHTAPTDAAPAPSAPAGASVN